MTLHTEGKAGTISWENYEDEDGNQHGGDIAGRGFSIDWQNGPLVDPETRERLEPNGAFMEDVLLAVKLRMVHLNAGKFQCRENALAITKIEEAMHWMQHRTSERQNLGIEGTHETH